jgi:hypothetical protein
MQVEAIAENGYALKLGRFGSLGYEVEPKIGLELLPREAGVYRIRTIPIPGYQAIGYDVDFQACLALCPAVPDRPVGSETITHANWDLDLIVQVQLPGFLQVLPQGLIRETGNRVLCEVVRQISRRLTHRVQQDFHIPRGLPLPKRRKKITPRAVEVD